LFVTSLECFASVRKYNYRTNQNIIATTYCQRYLIEKVQLYLQLVNVSISYLIAIRYKKVVSFRPYNWNNNLNFIIFPPFYDFKALIFGLLKCHTVWCSMRIISKISSVYDGNNKRAYSIFHFVFHLKKNAAAKICAAYERTL